jgi:hypothetical protein
MWVEIPEQLRDEIEILAKETGISAGELVGSLVENNSDELKRLALEIN